MAVSVEPTKLEMGERIPYAVKRQSLVGIESTDHRSNEPGTESPEKRKRQDVERFRPQKREQNVGPVTARATRSTGLGRGRFLTDHGGRHREKQERRRGEHRRPPSEPFDQRNRAAARDPATPASQLMMDVPVGRSLSFIASAAYASIAVSCATITIALKKRIPAMRYTADNDGGMNATTE